MGVLRWAAASSIPCMLLLPLSSASSPPASGTGAVVLSTSAGGEESALRDGDLVTAWRRFGPDAAEAASGSVTRPMDLLLALSNERPRGGFEVQISRGSEEGTWIPWPGGASRPEVGLAWRDDRRNAEREAVALLRQKDPSGVDQLEALARGTDLTANERAWLLYSAARGARSLSLGVRGIALAGEAAETVPEEGAADLALVLDLQGILAEQAGELESAQTLYERALALRGGLSGQSLGAAKALTSLGRVAWTRGELSAAKEHFAAALTLRSLLAPGSVDEADSFNDLGIIAWRLGDLDGAEANLRQCLAIQDRLVPEGVDAARTWNNLGLVAYDRGDLAEAEERFRRSFAVREHLIPRHPDTAQCLQNLGVVCWKRGNLAFAEAYLQRGLELERSLAPKGLGVAQSLHALGVLLIERADLAGGGDYLRQAQAIYEEVAPESVDVAQGLDALASLARSEGDLEEADRDLSRALILHRTLAPGTPLEAKALVDLALLRVDQGRRDEARQALEAAIVIWDKVAPESPGRAQAVLELGRLLGEMGAAAEGEAKMREALAEFRRLLPGTIEEADAAHALGAVLVKRGRSVEGIPLLMAALGALESDTRRAGESEQDRAGFRSRYSEMYEDAVAALVDARRPREAFAVLERSRAREFLTMLEERDLSFSAEISPELDRERRRIVARQASLREQLAALTPEEGERQKEVLGEMRELARRRDAVAADVQKASPRLARLTDPRPLGAVEVSGSLPRGTLLLSFAVGERRSFLFAFGPAPEAFAVFELQGSRRSLSVQVRRFRTELLSRREVDREADSLGRLLLGPALGPMLRAKTIVVCPDGSLATLPFAALRAPIGRDGTPAYLAEAKPVTTTASASVYLELRERPSRSSRRILALGDPDCGGAVPGGTERSGTPPSRWPPLPFSREEVAGIARQFGDAAVVRVGREANLKGLKAASSQAFSTVHLACHAFTDDLFPLDSGLALAAPEGGGDGVLRAWEILESVRLETDRVVLSACETGMGKEVRGEGIIGLVRAFHFSGAPTVVSSLWSISDEGTSKLMDRFYGYLRGGDPSREALRKAQADLLEGKAGAEWRHPFYWAAFQVSGDGR